MSRISVFGNPLFVGFERVERVMDQVARHSHEGYPPYNIEQWGTNGFRITLAVAGFSAQDLNVTLEDQQLVVRGCHQDQEDGERLYLHRGIATRQFTRSFVLADGLQVLGARLDQGLLHIDLQKPEAPSRIEQIPVQTPDTPVRPCLPLKNPVRENLP